MKPAVRSVGVPKEVKAEEYRIAITPDGVNELVTLGVEVRVESGAGIGSSITDAELAAAGARVITEPAAIWKRPWWPYTTMCRSV